MSQSNHYKSRILTASAGSGKTYSLAYEYIYNVLRDQPAQSGDSFGFNPNIYRTILAVTFTNKATEEMKSRILLHINNIATGEECPYIPQLLQQTALSEQELRRRAMVVRSAILHDYSRFSILTNDTFFQRIVRAFVKELGIEINYAVELDSAPVLQQSADTLISEMDDNKELQQWLLGLAKENIENGQEWNIRAEITKLRKELFKEQTKEPIERVKDKKELRDTIYHYIALAQKSIEQMQERAGKAVETISAAGMGHKDFAYGFTTFFEKAMSNDIKSLKISNRVLSHCTDTPSEWFAKSAKPSPVMLDTAATLQPLLIECIEDIEKRRYLENSCALLRKNYRSFALLYDLYEKVQELCREQNTMLLSQTKHTISSFVTEEDAPFIYEKIGNRFDYFMIDEFQDTSLKEWNNFLPLLRNAISQSVDTSVLIVGDIKQSIYRWRGSDWNILGKQAPEDLQARNSAVEFKHLDCNFRSLKEVVEFNNRTISAIVADENLRLNTMLDQALSSDKITQDSYNELYNALAKAYNDKELQQKPMRKSRNSGYVNITAYHTEEPDVVALIDDLVHNKGFNPCDITILVRKNDEAERIASILLQAGIDNPAMRFGIMTQEALKLNSNIVVQFILAVMRYAIDRKDLVSLGLYNKYLYNYDFTHTLTEEEIAFFDSLVMMTPEEAFEAIMIRFESFVATQVAYTQALHEHIIKFCANKVAEITLFLKWWDECSKDFSVTIEKSRNSIEVMTIHKAKGLENKVVIIPYCSWRLWHHPLRPATIWTQPSQNSGINSNMLFPVQTTAECKDSIFAEGYMKEFIYSHIDAINLLYVALTRAKEQLYVFFPAQTKNNEKESSPETVGELLYNILGMENQQPQAEGQDTEPIVYSVGNYDAPEKEKEQQEPTSKPTMVTLQSTHTSDYTLKLRLPSARYFESSQPLSPQDQGIMLHRAMERASTLPQIYAAVKHLVTNNILSQQSADELSQQIEISMQNPTIAEWFDGSWQSIRKESSIIIPGEGIKRPDRVMINGSRAIVVDYKFGAHSNSYHRQVAQYCTLLKQMGYKDVKGYIWYIRESKAEEVI